jgi:ESS family glutamate:Na+ symporter
VIIGLIWIKWGTRKKYTAFLSDYNELPEELQTGLLPEEKRESMGVSTCSSISMDSMTFNLSIICLIALGGYGFSLFVTHYLPKFELPVFSCAFVVGILFKKLLDRTHVSHYVCRQTVGHISGTLTDYLVAFGIASIKISVVLTYIVPLSILLLSGLLMVCLYVFLMAKKMMKESWFEKALFTWGWYTGTMAMGIALLRVVDPKMQSRCLDSYALAYLFIAPVEIILISLAPFAFVNGYGLLFSGICLLGGLGVMLFDEYTDNLAQVIASIINFLDPDVVALGGGVANAGEFLLEPVRAKIPQHVTFASMMQTKVLRAEMGNDAGIIGAALLGE